MTLQEAKDQISFKYFSVPYTKLLVLGSQLKVLDEAAELYARSKWDEACIACNDSVVNYYVTKKTRIHDDVTAYFVMQAPKPEFKP